MQSCNPAPPHLGVHLLKIIECSLSTYTKIWRVNEVFWRLFFPTLTCCSCCNLSVLWLAIVTFNEAKVPLKAVSCAVNEFDLTPPWNVYTAQFDPGWGHPTCHVRVIKLKWEIIWTGGLPHLPEVSNLHVNRDYMNRRLPHLPSGLFHLAGVPHLQVNRLLILTVIGEVTVDSYNSF